MNNNGLTDKENSKYGWLSVIIIISLVIFLGSLGYLIFNFVVSMIYWFSHDNLTCIQIFKLYLPQYIIGFIVYLVSTSMLKNSYNSWKILNEKVEDYKNKLHIVK